MLFRSYFYHYIAQSNLSPSFCYDLIRPILSKLGNPWILRIKANLYTNLGKCIEDAKHIDYPVSHKGALFFINSNDAPTILKDGTKIEAVENRLLKFDPSLIHNTTHPTNAKIRMTINFNYI